MGFFHSRTKEDRDVRLLCTLSDPFRTEILIGALEEEGIPYLRHEQGSGGVTKIITGYNSLGCEIYVSAEDLCRAQQLWEDLQETLSLDIETTDEDVEASLAAEDPDPDGEKTE